MPTNRMDREQFFAKVADLDEERAKKVLWNLYWRGSATVRQRIEAEIDPGERARRVRPSEEPADPEWVLSEVREFAALARSGAYLGGDRRVTPRQRTRWRFAFGDLVKDARSALRDEDVATAAATMEYLVDLACDMREHNYFRSDDPIEAARFVVSDAVALMWGAVHDARGFHEFARGAAPQLVRWERQHGWTRTGWGKVREKETSLASVLARMLGAADMWIGFADHYLDALDQTVREVKPRRSWQQPGAEQAERARNLAEWHSLLLDWLQFTEAEDRLDRLAEHPALGGPELQFLRARLARQRGDVNLARRLVGESLEVLPRHALFLDFAAEIDGPLPDPARQASRRIVS
jgi:hypothetical protein